jgi:hypothetical protein
MLLIAQRPVVPMIAVAGERAIDCMMAIERADQRIEAAERISTVTGAGAFKDSNEANASAGELASSSVDT